MSESRKRPDAGSPDTAVRDYSREFPVTPEERREARIIGGKVVAEKAAAKKPDPGETAAPYDGTRFHGTEDTSRFSTPPPKNP